MYSRACGINTGDKYVITGGYDRSIPGKALNNVTRYSRTGDTETLPPLKVARYLHACGSYLTDQGDNVRFIVNIISQLDHCPSGAPGHWRTQFH